MKFVNIPIVLFCREITWYIVGMKKIINDYTSFSFVEFLIISILSNLIYKFGCMYKWFIFMNKYDFKHF